VVTRCLILGCGSRKQKQLYIDGIEKPDEVVTLDSVASHKPDVLFDLFQIYGPGSARLPFDDDSFHDLEAIEVLEHLGQQGDYHRLFAQFSEFWRVLKPGGTFCATCPSWQSMWAWGDPSHSRIISPGTLVFLCQPEYTKQIGKTPMSDFRHIYKADFDVLVQEDNGQQFRFVLRAVKPSRITV
jgi:hypothetical protein